MGRGKSCLLLIALAFGNRFEALRVLLLNLCLETRLARCLIPPVLLHPCLGALRQLPIKTDQFFKRHLRTPLHKRNAASQQEQCTDDRKCRYRRKVQTSQAVDLWRPAFTASLRLSVPIAILNAHIKSSSQQGNAVCDERYRPPDFELLVWSRDSGMRWFSTRCNM